MKIDEQTINHNALRLMDDALTDLWGEGMDAAAKDAAMYCRGVMDMAEAMKEVLKL